MESSCRTAANSDNSQIIRFMLNYATLPTGFTVVFTLPPFSPENFPAVFHVCPFSGVLFGLRATTKTKEVKSFIFHSIARLRTPTACIRYRLYIFLGRDRFDSTASAGRRIPSASPIDLPEPIPEDPLPSSTPLRGRR